MRQLRGLALAVQRSGPQLAVINPCDDRAIRRNGGVVPIAEFARLATRDRRKPDFLLRSGRIFGGIGNFAFAVGRSSAREGQRRGIRRPGDFAQLLPVFGVEPRYRKSPKIRRARDPDIADALGIQHPRDGLAMRRCSQILRERRAQHLRDGKRGRGAEREREKERGECFHGTGYIL